MSNFNLKTLRKRFNITFSSRIFLGYFIIAGTSAWFLYDNLLDQIKPAMRQSVEYTLVDNANLLAEIFKDDVLQNTISEEKAQAILKAKQRTLNANIWSKAKAHINLNFYITNKAGIVIYDSNHQLEGLDYSRWRDVFLTLKGKYGARSTMSDPNDPLSTVMHVAAPVLDDQNNIIGVLTVYTPNLSLQPFLELSKKTTLKQGLILILITTIIGAILSIWLSSSIKKLANYAHTIGQGKKSTLPKLQGTELNKLSHAIEQMRIELEGKAYAEHYIQALTHEIKSPIAAIKGSAELITQDMPAQQHTQFIDTIFTQATRIECTIEQMLKLSELENSEQLDTQIFDVNALIDNLITQQTAHAQLKQLSLSFDHTIKDTHIQANQDLISIGLNNLIDNAIDFANPNSVIEFKIEKTDSNLIIYVENQGESIPEFAQTRIFDRFYSLPRPNGQSKSTGLGLSFVRQIMNLHNGSIELSNHKDANNNNTVVACMTLPLS
ncbi:two-component system sensor histidine kinase CreC [Marinicellulosiphila megalodicopiae]|uniref:two-component system sensor histidine kinase CreC n=1 Tax=Marinicellulosiphila megalodicopiae TaxID=2724896 RepID=UPI003BAE71A5